MSGWKWFTYVIVEYGIVFPIYDTQLKKKHNKYS